MQFVRWLATLGVDTLLLAHLIGCGGMAEPAPVPAGSPMPAKEPSMHAFPVPAGSRPHDVAPAVDGGVWYTAQGSGELGWLDPATGETRHTPLGSGSRPHGVIVGPDGAPWITDGGLNAIVRVDPDSFEGRRISPAARASQRESEYRHLRQ